MSGTGLCKQAAKLCLALAGLVVVAPPPAVAADPKAPAIYRKLTPEQREEVDLFAIHNAIATVFHEAGHMLISEFDLPVLGREEDAVDALATVLLLEAEDENLNAIVQDTADNWFLQAGAADEDEEYATWDSHGLNEQRAYSIICMMVGKSWERFGDYAESAEFPDYRREECQVEYQEQLASWNKVLAPHEAKEGEKTRFRVSYAPAGDARLAYFRELMKEAEVLELVEATFSGVYRLKDGIRVKAESCDEANAYWHAESREMTVCYEMLQEAAELDAQWLIDNPDDGDDEEE